VERRTSDYVSFVDRNKIFLVGAADLSKLSVLVFRDEIANFLSLLRQVDRGDFISRCILIRLDVQY